MKAVICNAFGPPDKLVIQDLEDPRPAPGEVIVDVRYLGLNFHETLVVAGKHSNQPQPPFSPGSEFSGVVSSVGEGVKTLRVGDRVAGNNDFGAARERLPFPASRLCRLPETISDSVGAAVRVTYGTSYYGLKQRARLKSGETLAVLGASGGVGLAAVEIGKAMGARVIACASSAERAAFTAEHGADAAVDYSSQNLKDELKQLSAGRGVDVIYDPVGGALSESAFRAIAIDGRHLVVGFAGGEIPRIPLNLPLVKSAALIGVYAGSWMQREPDQNAENLAELFSWIHEGRLRPYIHRIYPFEQFAEGLNLLASRQARGKVLIEVARG